jgi:hypothetical protein
MSRNPLRAALAPGAIIKYGRAQSPGAAPSNNERNEGSAREREAEEDGDGKGGGPATDIIRGDI